VIESPDLTYQQKTPGLG